MEQDALSPGNCSAHTNLPPGLNVNHDPAFDGLADGDDEDDDEPELSSDELDDESAWHRNFSSRTAALVSAASRSPFSRVSTVLALSTWRSRLRVAKMSCCLIFCSSWHAVFWLSTSLPWRSTSLQLFLGVAAVFQLFFKLLCLLLLCPQL